MLFCFCCFVGSKCGDDIQTDSIEKIPLLGKTLSYDVDLTNVGCGCNAAFYLVQMPCIGEDGNPVRQSF